MQGARIVSEELRLLRVAAFIIKDGPMPRLTKLEWEVVRDCLIFQDCNDHDGRPWGSSNNDELTDGQREKMDEALKSALDKLNR